MRILITVVGRRTEHWTDLFALLAAERDLEVTVVMADVSDDTRRTLSDLATASTSFDVRVIPHRLGEEGSGHMASIRFRSGALERAELPAPDVIHIIGEASYLSTRQVLRWRRHHHPGVPVTLYAAQNVVMTLPFPFQALERRSYHEISHALPITPAALDVLRQKGYRGPATVIPLGVDVQRFTPAPGRTPAGRRSSSRFTVGFVGRLEEHKGVDDLIDAAERLEADLVIIGSGSLEPEVRAAAERRPGRLRMIGWSGHDDLPHLLRQLDVLVLPSREIVQRNVVRWIGIPLREQFGRVLVEAMACGLPVVGSNVGEISHVIGPAGLIFPAGDRSALVARLARIRDLPGLGRRLGQVGRQRAETEFSWQLQVERLLAVWSACTERDEVHR